MPIAPHAGFYIEDGSNRRLARKQRGWALSVIKVFAAALVISVTVGPKPARADSEAQEQQFIGFSKPGDFEEMPGSDPGQKILLSPEIQAKIEFNEAIVSWNAQMPRQASLRVEARALYPDSATKYYCLGVWASESAEHPRHSVPNQADQDGKVATDTLILSRPARNFQVRLTLAGEGALPALKFIGVCLCQTNAALSVGAPNRSVWGKTLPVPERSQMPYPNGKVWCSPTTVSMLMGFWSKDLKRPELDRSVPAVAEAVYDSEWKGTGNWVFNMAYAGSFPGMRAYVTRLSDVSEIEAWIGRGIPVGLSLDYDRLRGKGPGPNGHLVVCVGFTPEGDPVINDPGTTQHVQKIFRRANLIDAWSCSRNTVYLVYPEGLATPNDPFGHWDSPQTRASNR
ncbi:MAG TPA: C39 family peptidase [Verrucomicrobiae bacterium]|nr:C39 family peptidase [Verrucomicrobiae bacterium]